MKTENIKSITEARNADQTFELIWRKSFNEAFEVVCEIIETLDGNVNLIRHQMSLNFENILSGGCDFPMDTIEIEYNAKVFKAISQLISLCFDGFDNEKRREHYSTLENILVKGTIEEVLYTAIDTFCFLDKESGIRAEYATLYALSVYPQACKTIENKAIGNLVFMARLASEAIEALNDVLPQIKERLGEDKVSTLKSVSA